ncbi:MAG: ribbon-helix-helix protein, CopG family [Methanomicrobium sp.]|nr:ribbon-helix-helix protein, CopG family [Methanomicrobium sp.]
MVKERKKAQTTVRMSESMKKEIDSAAEILGISSMEYIRRACREKLDRDYKTGQDPDNVKKTVLEVLDEIGVKYRINKE